MHCELAHARVLHVPGRGGRVKREVSGVRAASRRASSSALRCRLSGPLQQARRQACTIIQASAALLRVRIEVPAARADAPAVRSFRETAMSATVIYETDFHAWALHNAGLLRAGKLAELDVEHIAEELEGMSASERRELLNRLQVLLLHLLKYQFQPERRGKSWLLTISHQRTAIERLLEQSPSLRSLLVAATLNKVYGKAVRDAVIETDLERHLFPVACPYGLEQVLDEDWLPES